jgi:hypothetical protein
VTRTRGSTRSAFRNASSISSPLSKLLFAIFARSTNPGRILSTKSLAWRWRNQRYIFIIYLRARKASFSVLNPTFVRNRKRSLRRHPLKRKEKIATSSYSSTLSSWLRKKKLKPKSPTRRKWMSQVAPSNPKSMSRNFSSLKRMLIRDYINSPRRSLSTKSSSGSTTSRKKSNARWKSALLSLRLATCFEQSRWTASRGRSRWLKG